MKWHKDSFECLEKVVCVGCMGRILKFGGPQDKIRTGSDAKTNVYRQKDEQGMRKEREKSVINGVIDKTNQELG